MLPGMYRRCFARHITDGVLRRRHCGLELLLKYYCTLWKERKKKKLAFKIVMNFYPCLKSVEPSGRATNWLSPMLFTRHLTFTRPADG